MKICVVVGEFPTLSHTFVLKQIEALMALGHEISVVCDRIGTDPQLDFSSQPLRSIMKNTHQWWPTPLRAPAKLTLLPARFQDKMSVAADMIWNSKINDCDVVLAHFGGNGLRLARVKKQGRLSPPLATIFHGNDVGVPYHTGSLNRYRPLFSHGALHLTVNRVFQKMLVEAGASSATTHVHRMGIDADDINFAWRPLSPDGPLEFISVCRLVEKKGVEFALRAFARLNSERPNLKWRYTIIGDGPLLDEMKALSHSLHLDMMVRFFGARSHDEVKAQLSRSHALVLPSVVAQDGDMEGVPVAIMEAMAAGLIVVSSRHSGIPELVDDRLSGFLSDEKDVSALAQDMGWIMENHAACETIAKAARQKVEQEFNNDALNLKLSELLSEIVSRKKAA